MDQAGPLDGVVTGEGVLLDTRPASFATRLLAAVIDLAVLGVVGVAVTLTLGALSSVGLGPGGVRTLTVLAVAGVTIVAPTTVETLSRGRSVGKLALGIRIVRDDGGPVRLRQSLVRALVGLGELWLSAGSVALICSIVHPQGKRVGDILAGTYAVRVRGRAPVRRPVVMPPYLAAWAGTADIARLPDGLALAVRQFLARATTLHPSSRVRMGEQLTAETLRHVAPAPPPGTHPEDFLAAVLAERRQREEAVLVRAAVRAESDSEFLRRLPHGILDPEN